MSEAILQTPLLQAVDLKKHYPVKSGLFSQERLVKALDGVSFSLERGKPWRWSGSQAAVSRRWDGC